MEREVIVPGSVYAREEQYMSHVQEYKCPRCGGAVAFDSGTQKLKCPYCGTEFDIEALESYENDTDSGQTDDMNWETSAGGQWQAGEAEGLCTFVCKSCGGEIVGDENTAATSCPFCGNPVVMTGQFSGALKPDYIIPFKLDKKAAKAALQKHYGGKRLLPPIFRDQNHIDEIKGVYVPFWLFDADAEVSVHYKATSVQKWSDSNYNYTETSYFSVSRSGVIGFEQVPVDGSTKMPDDLMESIEPFRFDDAVEFKSAYLAGYLADKYDVDAAQSTERANTRIKRSAEEAFASTVKGYTSVTPETSIVKLYGGSAKYALLPVWLLNTTWNGEIFTFAMNGQTGKLVGDLPVDRGAARKWTIGITVLCGAVVYGLAWLLHLAGAL